MKKFILVATLTLSAFATVALERGDEFRKNILSAVRVRAPDGLGSGFAIGKRTVLTAGHVVNGHKEVEVTFFDEEGKPIKQVMGKVKRVEETGNFDNDLGVIELPEDAPSFRKPDIAAGKMGDEGYTVGGPTGEMPHVVAVGTFAGTSERIPAGILSAISAPGASGSAVFDSKHRLVGVLVSGIPNVCIYYITDERIREILK
jgi:S1-C subfamily serine protease